MQLRKEGCTYSEIVRQLGCSKGTVSYHCGPGQKAKTMERTRERRNPSRLCKNGGKVQYFSGEEKPLRAIRAIKRKINHGILCKCGETQQDHFYRVTGYHNECKKCFNKRVLARHNAAKLRGVEFLGSKCVACGFNKWVCSLEFHHVDPSQKDPRSVSMRSWTWERMKEELKKCILLCSNCHRAVHAGKEIFNTPVTQCIECGFPKAEVVGQIPTWSTMPA